MPTKVVSALRKLLKAISACDERRERVNIPLNIVEYAEETLRKHDEKARTQRMPVVKTTKAQGKWVAGWTAAIKNSHAKPIKPKMMRTVYTPKGCDIGRYVYEDSTDGHNKNGYNAYVKRLNKLEAWIAYSTTLKGIKKEISEHWKVDSKRMQSEY